MLQCHGSFATATCINCKFQVQGKAIEQEILSQEIPVCKVCNTAPIPPKQKPSKKSKKRKSRSSSGWVSDESEESDRPILPKGIMKVRLYLILLSICGSIILSAGYHIFWREVER